MVQKVSHKELVYLIEEHYKKKVPLFVWGRFGIGKSALTKKVAKKVAESRGRTFIEWNKLTEEKRQEVFEFCEKYFIYIDIRLSEYDASDIKGLPNFRGDKKSIEFKVPFWATLVEKPNSDGILLFDEINLATPIVISSCYKIIYDRIINESKINDNWLIMGAGNTTQDRAYTHEVAPPVRDRGSEVELVGANADEWTQWAIENDIDSRIIGFLNFKTGALYSVNFEDEQKFTTYRGWGDRVSPLIKGIVSDYDKLRLLVCSAIGEGIGGEFVAFCKISEQINLPEIIKKPDKIANLQEIQLKWFIVSAAAEHYKDKKIDFDKVLEFSRVLDKINNAELVACLWKWCSSYDKKFKELFLKSKNTDDLAKKYAKYLIEE